MRAIVVSASPYFISVILLLSACSERHEIKSSDWKNSFLNYEMGGHFIKTGQKKFILDSLTSLRYPIIQYVESAGLIVAFTSYDCSFVLFDYLSSRCIRKIKVSNDPVIGIGRVSTSFTCNFNFVNYDSIYLFNSDNGRIISLDSSGQVRRSYSVISKIKSRFQPHTNFGELMEIANGALFLDASPGMNILKPDHSLKDNLVAALDIGTGQINYSIKYPQLYTEAFWGEHLYEFYSAYNKSQNCFVRSFPIEHSIYVYDSSGSVTKYYAGSKQITYVRPYLYSKGNIDPKLVHDEKEVANYINQRSYYRIYYDPFAKLYYRFVTSAIPDPATGKSTTFSIIVLDEKFKMIAEQEFDSSVYSEVSMFITDQGLHLLLNDPNEDEITYDIYRFRSDSVGISRS